MYVGYGLSYEYIYSSACSLMRYDTLSHVSSRPFLVLAARHKVLFRQTDSTHEAYVCILMAKPGGKGKQIAEVSCLFQPCRFLDCAAHCCNNLDQFETELANLVALIRAQTLSTTAEW